MTEPEKEPGQNFSPKPLRTFQSDVEEILKGGASSLAKIAIAENEKKIESGFFEENTEKPERTKLIIGISLSLISIGIIGLGALYFWKSPEQVSLKTPVVQPLFTSDIEKNINVQGFNREKIVEALLKERDGNIAPLSSVVSLRLTEGKSETARPISTEELFAKLQAHVPSVLERSLDGNFMFGIHVLNKNRPFIVLKTRYYQNAFAGMLEWEGKMRDDLGEIFIPPEPTVAASTTDDVLGRQSNIFQDITVKNRDTRALRGSEGKIIFLYAFPDKNTIVITTNTDTLEKVAARLLAGKLVQ